MKTFSVLLISAALLACKGEGNTVAATGPARSCDKMAALSEQQKINICGFYKMYLTLLEKKDVQPLLKYISEEYRGSDGLNAEQIKAAMKKQMPAFPWSAPAYEQFESHGDFSRVTIIHTMNVRLPDGNQQQVKEGLTWSKGRGGKFFITNWRHKL